MKSHLFSQTEDDISTFLNDRVIVSTKAGLRKKLNEDAIGHVLTKESVLRISIADGHWGQEAARMCVEHWMDDTIGKEPIQSMIELETALANRFAVPSPNAEVTRTPEASTLTITIYPDKRMDIVGYGDCRLSVVRDSHVIYRYETAATWLGLFSSVGLRGRIPARSGTLVESVQLNEGDTVLLYTDGVDECIYERPTLNVEGFVYSDAAVVQIYNDIMGAVFDHGAEDNATIAILRV